MMDHSARWDDRLWKWAINRWSVRTALRNALTNQNLEAFKIIMCCHQWSYSIASKNNLQTNAALWPCVIGSAKAGSHLHAFSSWRIKSCFSLMLSSKPFHSLAMKLLLVFGFVLFSQVEAYRLPLPYGTGVRDRKLPSEELVKQDFFGHLWSLFNQRRHWKMVPQKGR